MKPRPPWRDTSGERELDEDNAVLVVEEAVAMDFVMGKLFFKDNADSKSISGDPHEAVSCADVGHGGE